MSAGKDWTKKEVKELVSEYTAITVPVNVTIDGKQKILSMPQVERIVRASRNIAIIDCRCRVKMKKCDAPVNVCLCFDDEAKEMIESGDGRKASLNEALETLRKSYEAGLVHITYTNKGEEDRPYYICSCCSCCCHSFYAMQKFGFNDVVMSSEMIAAQDDGLCNDCGDCADRCHFKARTIKGDHLIFEKEKCSGCGLCVTSCPTHAISLIGR
jgi:ferredoxin